MRLGNSGMIDLSFYKNKKVFITGHNGFKGSYLCHVLLHAGADVTGYSLEQKVHPSLFELTGLKKNVCSIVADVRNRDKLVEAVKQAKPEIVFHLAAQPLVRLSYREPAETYEINVMGTVNVLEAVRAAPSVCSFVNVTTDKVYENKEWCWGYRENERLCGFDPYSNSKSCSDLITCAYRNSFFANADSPAVSTARSGNVIGGGDYAEDRIIPDCIRAARSGKKIVIRNPDSIRPYQHVLECLYGYLLLGEKQCADKTLCGAYNFGPDGKSCVTTGELAALFCEVFGDGASWVSQSDGGPHEANFLKLDATKAQSALGWKPRWDIQKAVEKTVEFEKCIGEANQTACLQKQIVEYFEGKNNV
jgi:CDP-glucose 4,6-dehydratase